ncbi:hypothetical protein VIBNISOn1_240001 [Vibrio nigripulchritudo SOn1]|uniref:Uncharacterized protein n=1 Tax=Vibrio nigripulchritudo SOn1 TaxID=1238450 RepID=A0AAV2VQZ8_9VIBR|nr:hypothetical protein VIBNISOn1_240001 [Vibrio nigripulchritudo SOn1]
MSESQLILAEPSILRLLGYMIIHRTKVCAALMTQKCQFDAGFMMLLLPVLKML